MFPLHGKEKGLQSTTLLLKFQNFPKCSLTPCIENNSGKGFEKKRRMEREREIARICTYEQN